MMINLDDKETVLVTQGGDKVLKSIEALGKQLQQSFEESLRIAFPDEFKRVKNIVVGGLGGSRFPALIVKELFKKEVSLPFIINDDYHLPEFVNEDTLVILSSYSGTTEEVLVMTNEAIEKKAKITGITTGGQLAEFLKSKNYPFYQFNPIYNPSAQPRIGFGYNVGGLIGLLINLGFLKIKKEAVRLAINSLENLIKTFYIEVPTKNNPAKKLAQQLFQKYPYFIVAEFLTGVGNAIANQTNETAKAISSFRVIPELNHHLMEGLKFPDRFREIAVFVFFFSKFYSLPIQKRFLITKEVVEQNKIKTIWHELSGKNKIEQVFELMALGSFMTMYLASLYQQDPSVIPYVDYFKKKLKE